MRREPHRRTDAPALRAATVLLAVLHLAALAVFATHHHTGSHDTSPCLVCVSASSPAAQIGHAETPAPSFEESGPVFHDDESRHSFFALGSADVRAPPAC